MSTSAANSGAHRSERWPLDWSLYLITDRRQCSEHGVPATVEAAVAGGVTAVQLRDPNATDEELTQLGRELVSLLAGSHIPLLINDRVDLVEAIGADGAHIGQSDVSVTQARRTLGADSLLGLSISTEAELDAARNEAPAAIDYLGIGPVWSTASKPDHTAPIGVTGLSELTAASPWPVVAIGGIGLEQIAPVRATGVDGVAVISAVCSASDPQKASHDLRRAWEGASR
ncbi:thiamine phosphate synthase [soil metagenome]